MVGKSNVHGPATFMQATGFVLPGFPSMGAWVSYGLGSLSENLPAFVVLPDPRLRAQRPGELGCRLPAGRAPGDHDPAGRPNPIADLFPPNGTFITRASEADGPGPAQPARTAAHGRARPATRASTPASHSYELAARMQLSAPEVLDISEREIGRPTAASSTGSTGRVTEDFGRNCLVARRLLERGVRFVQVWSGADNGFPRRNWDCTKTSPATTAAGR